jgi:hypothetical protein
MIDLSYELTPEHVRIYQRIAACRARGLGPRRSAPEEFGSFLLCATLAGALIGVGGLVLEPLTGRPFAVLEFLFGLVSGIAILLAVMWWRYWQSARRAVRAGGPTLSERRVVVTGDGFKASNALFDTIYRWSAFEDVTVEDGLVVLWI